VTRCAIDPDATPSLIIGGLPSNRAMPLLSTLALSATFLLVAIRQLARDRELARMRTDFVSSVSHELRTPLTQIRMFAETLKFDRVRSEAERRRSLEIIDQEVRRLSDLVDNILCFSRGERGATRIAPEECDLVALVSETIERFVPISSECGTRIRLESEPYLEATVDPDSMRRVVLNLLENAVRYGPAEQEIVVSLSEDDERIVIVVDDEGPGVPTGDRDRVWRKFHRLERDRERHHGGLGIGLAVVRDIVALHHGTTAVRGGARGGAQFVIELPASPPSRRGANEIAASESRPQ
jgi:two-component system phosphate regulon sensor histidine kinase PhoR